MQLPKAAPLTVAFPVGQSQGAGVEDREEMGRGERKEVPSTANEIATHA